MKQTPFPLKPAAIMMAIGAILNIALWLFAIFMFPSNEAAVLHYSVNIGIDFIGEAQQIILLPLIGLLIFIGNNILGLAIKKTDLSSAWLAWSSATIIQLILLGAFFLIMQAN